jgi:hypothetical protein
MQEYSYAELTEFLFLAQSTMDTQFQYWVTLTFAAVVAAFLAGEALLSTVRILAAVLYLMASLVLILRFASAGLTTIGIRGFLDAANASVVNSFGLSVLPVLRMPLLIFGTVAVTYFLIRPFNIRSRRTDGE